MIVRQFACVTLVLASCGGDPFLGRERVDASLAPAEDAEGAGETGSGRDGIANDVDHGLDVTSDQLSDREDAVAPPRRRDAASEGSASGDSGGESDAQVDVDSGPPDSICPSIPPTSGLPCVGGAICSFGVHPRPDCRAIWSCKGKEWTALKLPACPKPASTCGPPYFTVGQTCSPQDKDCTVPNGTTASIYCRCKLCDTGACIGKLIWGCTGSPAIPCPADLPNEGQHCAVTTTGCEYGSCDTGTKVTIACVDDHWEWTPIACQ